MNPEALGDIRSPMVLCNGQELEQSMKSLNMMMLQKDGSYKNLPIGLTPVSFKRDKLKELRSLQSDLIDWIMLGLIKESSVIVDLLESVAKTDDFIHRLLTIYKKAISSDIYSKKPYLSIIRSDFFFDAQSLSWKLIEINTIAVAGGFFSDGIDKLYLERNLENKVFLADQGKRTDVIVEGILAAHQNLVDTFYRGVLDSNANISRSKSGEESKSQTVGILYNDLRDKSEHQVIMENTELPFAVLILARNYQETFHLDQLGVANKISKKNIPVIVSSFEDISKSAYKVTNDKRLIFTTRDQKVTCQLSCVYFRGGYDPNDYVDDACWQFVEDAELSRAVLVPSVGLHLAGTKRVQCALNENDGELLRKLQPKNALNDLFRSTFVHQFELNCSNVEEVIGNCHKYVVKPQREGGTNNLFGEDIVKHVESLENKSLLSRYIAMELIKGQGVNNYPVRTKDGDTVYLEEAVAEVGACSVLLVDPKLPEENQVVRHQFAGLVTKIKRATSNEAGVSVGHGFLTSLSSVPEDQ